MTYKVTVESRENKTKEFDIDADTCALEHGFIAFAKDNKKVAFVNAGLTVSVVVMQKETAVA